jgi:hypothetical protein
VKNGSFLYALLCYLTVLSPSTLAMERIDDQGLKSNPFSQPPMAPEPRHSRSAGDENKTPGELVLRGTLTAASNPLANISGVLLGVGESIGGFQLVSVGEREVVLEKDGVRKTLSMDKQ